MYYYDSRPLNEDLNMRIQRQQAKSYEEKEKGRIFAESIAQKRYDQRNKELQYSKFLEETKSVLLTEALFFFVNESLPESSTLEQRKQAEAMVYNFVNEQSATRLLKIYEEKTELLANVANTVNKTFQKIVSETSCNDTSFCIKQSSTDDFYGKIRSLKNDEMCQKIADNVAKETQKFIEQQVKDNNRIEDLARQTKEKIDNVTAKNAETKESIKQEFANMYKRTANNIRVSRPRSIFEEMVYHISDKVVKDNTLLEGFFLEQDGKLDIDKIIDYTTTMYTVLECMNTYKFTEFDSNSIKTVIDNI